MGLVGDPDCQLVEPESQPKNQPHHQNEESTKYKQKKRKLVAVGVADGWDLEING